MNKFQEIQTLKNLGVIANDAPMAHVEKFMRICGDLNINPFRQELFLSKKYHPELGNIFITFAGINGLNKLAHATGEYTGCDEPFYTDDKEACAVAVYRNGQKFSSLVFIKEYKPLNNVVWNQFPLVMIAKVAKAHSLRAAFPELNALYIEEELSIYMDHYIRNGKDKRVENQMDELIKKINKKQK